MATKRARSKKNNNLIEEGVGRVEEAFNQLGDDFEQLQKRAEKRRKEFERNAERRLKKFRTELRKNEWVKRAEKQRKDLEKRADRFRKDVESSRAFKKVEEIRKDTNQALEDGVDAVLETMRIASQGEVTRLERQVKALQRKVRELELERGAA